MNFLSDSHNYTTRKSKREFKSVYSITLLLFLVCQIRPFTLRNTLENRKSKGNCSLILQDLSCVTQNDILHSPSSCIWVCWKSCRIGARKIAAPFSSLEWFKRTANYFLLTLFQIPPPYNDYECFSLFEN